MEKELEVDGTNLCELLTRIFSVLEVSLISLFCIYFTTSSLHVQLEYTNASYLLGFVSKDMGRIRDVLALDFNFFFLLLREEYEV